MNHLYHGWDTMSSGDSTDSVSFASNMAYRLRAGFSRIARAVVMRVERLVGKPFSRTTRYQLVMSATSRSSFAWEPTKVETAVKDSDIPNLFVRVEPDIPVLDAEEPEEEFFEEPIVEKVYNTPSYSTITTPTSSEAVMYEFSSSRFDLDMFGLEDVDSIESQAEVYEVPAIREYEYVETEEEKQYFEGLYEDLEVEAVLDYMDTIELYPAPVVESKDVVEEQVIDPDTSSFGGYISAPVSQISGYISAPVTQVAGLIASPAEYVETEEEKRFYESVYEDLTVFAVLDYMDTIELYAKPKVEETEEEKQYFEGLYEDLEVEAVLDYMDTIELEPRFVPDYVISEIQSAEECETKIIVEAARPVPVKQGILAQFVFGFDSQTARSGPTKFRFIAGEEEEPEEDIEDIQIMSYSGDAAVSANSVSNGPLAL